MLDNVDGVRMRFRNQVARAVNVSAKALNRMHYHVIPAAVKNLDVVSHEIFCFEPADAVVKIVKRLIGSSAKVKSRDVIGFDDNLGVVDFDMEIASSDAVEKVH